MTQPRLRADRADEVLPARQRAVMLTVVLANYVAQIPYAIDLYGTHVNPGGVLLLLATLAWFLAGVTLQQRGGRVGYWLLTAFLITEFLFYFHGQILQIFNGFGLVYDIVHARDMIVRVVFLVGDVNFLAAGYFAGYLFLRGRRRRGQEKNQTGEHIPPHAPGV